MTAIGTCVYCGGANQPVLRTFYVGENDQVVAYVQHRLLCSDCGRVCEDPQLAGLNAATLEVARSIASGMPPAGQNGARSVPHLRSLWSS